MNARNAVLLHGKPSREKYFDPDQPKPHQANWLPWAKGKLESSGYEVITPELPTPYNPHYLDCKQVLDGLPIGEKTTLVGLSFGAGLILKYMSEKRDLVVDRCILVAPWLDPNGKYGDLFEFKVDGDVSDRCWRGITVFYSSKDDNQAKRSLAIVGRAVLNARYKDIPEYGHFMIGNTMERPEFPELMEELVPGE